MVLLREIPGGDALREEIGNIFTVREVEITGLKYLSEPKVLAQIRGMAIGRSIFDLPMDQIEARLGSDPWTREIRLKKKFPGTLEVSVTEKTPSGYLRDGEVFYIMDRDGNPVARAASVPSGLVEIKGVRPGSWFRGDARERHLSARAAEFITISEQPNFMFSAGVLESIEVLSGDDLNVRIGGTGFLFRRPYSARPWLRYLSVKQDIVSRHPEADLIDLRFPDKVIVKTTNEKV